MTQPDSTPKKFADGRRSLLYSMVALFVVFNAAILVRTLRKDGTGEATTNVVNGRVLLKGTSRPELPLPLDPACAKLWAGAKPTTRFYLIGANGGLGDVFVHVKSGLTNHNFTVPTNPVIMRKAGCVYTDYVIGVQTGQTITVRSTDPVLCNVHMTPTNRANAEWNKAMVPGSRGPTSVAKPPSRINLLWNKWSARIAKLLGRPAAQLPPPVSELGFQIANAELPVRLKCDVHPWEFAYIFCVDHPFFAVTDTNGMFHFPQPLPPGKYVLEAIHRKAGRLTKEIEITDGRGARVDFEFEVK